MSQRADDRYMTAPAPAPAPATVDGRAVADLVRAHLQTFMASAFTAPEFDHAAHEQRWADHIVPKLESLDETGRTAYWERTVELLTPHKTGPLWQIAATSMTPEGCAAEHQRLTRLHDATKLGESMAFVVFELQAALRFMTRSFTVRELLRYSFERTRLAMGLTTDQFIAQVQENGAVMPEYTIIGAKLPGLSDESAERRVKSIDDLVASAFQVPMVQVNRS